MKKTSNSQRRTSNVERGAHRSTLHETPNAYGVAGDRSRKFDLEDRLLEFAVEVVELTDSLPNTRAVNHIAAQLLRSGTSPYGVHGEAESAESRKDFVHKLKLCLKELRETRRWLRLLSRMKSVSSTNVARCTTEADELIRIFAASIRTALTNDKRKQPL